MYIEYSPRGLQIEPDNEATEARKIYANVGNTLLKEIECEIGGQRIDRHYGHWLTIWNDLTEYNPTCHVGTLKNTSGAHGGEPISTGSGKQSSRNNQMSYNHKGLASFPTGEQNNAPFKAYIPLQFWFCRNPGLALPLIALQYHEVKIKVKFADLTDLTDASADSAVGGRDSNLDPQLWIDYIYLDTDERRRFAQVSHEYLIEQLQFRDSLVPESNSGGNNGSFSMNFNHPVKELIFAGKPESDPNNMDANYSISVPKGIKSGSERIGDLKIGLKLNGHERFAPRNITYFTRTQVYQHHTGNGGVIHRDSIGVYSFALKPEEHQPSGTCNFSRIDNAELTVKEATQYTPAINIYAVNYNVLRIMSGMGGLAYSN
jgi:hypothetical protein